MRRPGKSESRAVLRLCPPPSEAARLSQAPRCTLPPSRGKFVLNGLDCRIIRRCDGILACYVRVPHTHELYGQTDLGVLSAALDCPEGVTYSAGGADGWFIGSASALSWHDARELLEDLAGQIAGVAPSEVWGMARIERVSGISFTLIRGEGRTVEAG
jgi:hypothetical protein